MIQPLDIAEMQRDYMLAASALGRRIDASMLIIERECKEAGVEVMDVLGPGRTRKIAHLRQDIMRLIRERTNTTLENIGLMFGGRDHTTVGYSIEASKARQEGETMSQYFTARSAAPKLAKTPQPVRELNPKGLSYAEVCRRERERVSKRDGGRYVPLQAKRTGSDRVLRLVQANPGISRDDAHTALGISAKTLNNHTRRLESEGSIIRLRSNLSEPFRYYPRAAQ